MLWIKEQNEPCAFPSVLPSFRPICLFSHALAALLLAAAAQGHDGGAAAGRAGEFGLNAVHAAQAFASHHFIERASAGHMAAVRSGSPDTNFFRFFT